MRMMTGNDKPLISQHINDAAKTNSRDNEYKMIMAFLDILFQLKGSYL